MLSAEVAVVFGYSDVARAPPGAQGPGCRVISPGRSDLRAAGGDEGLPGHDPRRRHRDGGHVRDRDGRQEHPHHRPHAADEGQAIIGNIGHFDNEIDMAGLAKSGATDPGQAASRPVGAPGQGRPPEHSVLILAEGRLLNLGCTTGHPSFVMSCRSPTRCSRSSICTSTPPAGRRSRARTRPRRVSVLPKKLDRTSPAAPRASWESK